MSNADKLAEIVAILTDRQIPFEADDERSELCLLRGSTALYLDVRDWGEGSLVHLRSPVVLGFPVEADMQAHRVANTLNRRSYFAKFVVYDDEVSGGGLIEAEMDLLADDMQASELLNAVGLVSGLADQYDDELAEQLRGRRFRDT